jgi:MFS family permease
MIFDRILGESTLEKKFAVHYFISRAWFLGSFWLIFILSKGFSLVDAASMDVAFWFSIMIFEIPTGYIADFFGRKISVYISMIVQAFAIFIFSQVETFSGFLSSFILWGIGITLLSGAEEAWLYDEVVNTFGDDSNYQTIYGRMIGIGFIASALSGMLSGVIAEISLVWTVYATSIVMVISSFWLLTIPHTRGLMTKEEKPSLREGFSSLKGDKISPLILLQLSSMGLLLSMFFFFQIFLDENDVRYTYIAIIISSGSILVSLGSNQSARITEKFGENVLFAAILVIGTLLIIMSLGLVHAIVAYILIRFFRGISSPIFSKLVNQQIPSRVRATSLSIIGAFATIAILTIEFGTAVFIENRGFNPFFVLLGVSTIFVTVIIFMYMFYNKKEGSSVLISETVG